MYSNNEFINLINRQDWLIWLGTVITFLWLVGGIWYVVHVSLR
jgi:hypothetical protein